MSVKLKEYRLSLLQLLSLLNSYYIIRCSARIGFNWAGNQRKGIENKINLRYFANFTLQIQLFFVTLQQ